MSKKISILGSTGSIGLSALRVIRNFKNDYQVVSLSCNSNLDLLEQQIREFTPLNIAVVDEVVCTSDKYKKMKAGNPQINFFEGKAGLKELASQPADILLTAIVGSAGLEPTIAAIPNIKRLALANKETLVMAGDIVNAELKQHNVELIPVDSEHSAIFSLIDKVEHENIDRLILTASGGSLRDKSLEELKSISVEEALAHPIWDMGSKITIDSATLINKGLEVIEAHYLFNQDYDNIDVIIHPESIIHSMVETVDGAVYAHMGQPDMVFPILNAFAYPEKKANPFGKIDFSSLGELSFRPYDSIRFPALELCYQAGRTGGTMPAVLNAANEVAVEAFLDRKLKYTDIVRMISKTMEDHQVIKNPDINQILSADLWARDYTKQKIKE